MAWLAACAATSATDFPADNDSAADPSVELREIYRYVRLDGEPYDTFAAALDAARGGSTIEVCGLHEGPFEDLGPHTELDIVGCDRDYAILDGMEIGSVLRLNVDVARLSDITLTRGRGSYEEYSCGEEGDCVERFDAFVDGARERLELRRVAFTDAVAEPDRALAYGILVSSDSDSDGVSAVAGEDCAFHSNYTTGEARTFIVVAGGTLDLARVDWGTNDDENGSYDVNGPTGDGTYSHYDLSGLTDAYCDEESGCSFPER